MCGIAGFASTVPARNDTGTLQRMVEAISHRGPDGKGFYCDDRVALGHARLAIIDVAGGSQPTPNESEDLWIIYNGEVFNHADLRPDLEQHGHRYRSHCDTETILHAYEEYGPECLQRFRGMFSFAVWDRNKHLLFCARDRLGIKPFYYWWDGRTFVFGSEIKALLRHPDVSPELRDSALPEFLTFGFCSTAETMFRGIRKLMPGHYLELDLNAAVPSPVVRQYWEVPVGLPERRKDDEWIEETRCRLEETVRMRLMSDVPLGMFLSGGVDSGAIAALIRRMSGSTVKTFSVGYAESAYSELAWAGETARLLGTDHHEVVIGMADFFSALPKLVWHEDEPIAWPSSVSLYYVSRLAARHVKVVLTGEGSDEIFAGYRRYAWTRMNLRLLGAWRRVAPRGVRRSVRELIAGNSMVPRNLRRKLGHSFLGREESIESLYVDNFYAPFSASVRRRLLGSPGSGDYDSFRHYWDAGGAGSLLNRMLYTDQKTYLVELLMKQDQMSMATSIESRVPFLDHTFVEFAMRMPDQMKIRGGTQKYVLKQAIADLLPGGIIHRKKMGFPTPLRAWLRDPATAPLLDYLLDPRGLVAACLDTSAVRNVIDEHRAGTHDGTDGIWNLLNLQIWGDTFLTGRREQCHELFAATLCPDLMKLNPV